MLIWLRNFFDLPIGFTGLLGTALTLAADIIEARLFEYIMTSPLGDFVMMQNVAASSSRATHRLPSQRQHSSRVCPRSTARHGRRSARRNAPK